MKRVLQNALEKWEKSLFWLTVVIWIAIGGGWLYGRLGGGEGDLRPPRKTQTPPSLVNLRTALAFRKPPAPLRMDRDPFLFVLKVPKVTAIKPWKKHPKFHVKIPAVKRITPPKPKKPRTVQKKTTGRKPKPKKKIVRIIQYQGCMTTASGKKMALIRELTTKRLEYMAPGSRLGELIIQDFDTKGLRVKDPQGKVSTIGFSQKRPITFEEPGG